MALDTIVPVVGRSFATWEEVPCTDVAFIHAGESDTRTVGHDEDGRSENLILFRLERCEDVVPADEPCRADGDCASTFDCWGFADTVIAVTTTTFSRETGEILDADIEFNAATFEFTTSDGPPCDDERLTGCVSTDLENTATHEIGHFLGLDHSPVSGATMYASAPPGETSKRRLTEDDRAGVCAIYPAGSPPSTCEGMPAPTVIATGCGCGSGGDVGLEALLLLLPILIRRAARRGPETAGSRCDSRVQR